MVKKIIKIALILLGIGLTLFLIVLNLNSFIETTNRFCEIADISNLKNFFEVYNDNSTVIYDESIKEIEEAINTFIESVETTMDRPFEDILLEFLANALDFGFNFIIYFCNYGLNGILISYILLHEIMSGTQITVKTSPLAGLFISLSNFITTIKNYIVRGIRWLLHQAYIHRRKIALILFLLLLGKGIIYRFLVEFLIFLITYVIKMINLETYLLVFELIQAIFTFIYPKLKYVPSWLYIPLLIIIIFLNAISRANYKLKKNHQRLKEFASEELTQTTFINGPPGTGKTLLNVSLTLASEENYIRELEKLILDYELKYKYLNFATIRANLEQFKDGEHAEYVRLYKLLTTRSSLIISNFSIYSPLFNTYSKIFNFDYMRVNKPTDVYPLEEYTVISISEFDKEYNSHDNKKEVGEDGAATFFSTVSHDLKRHVKIFVDYQLKDQVPLRIRGNSEYFITIKKRLKKYPVILFIYYLPFLLCYKATRYYIKRYESNKRTLSKKSTRTSVACYKRNDITLPYAILRSFGYTLKKVCDWFDQFYYFKLITQVSQEGETSPGVKKKLYINIRDLEFNNNKLYDSTFLSYSYSQKKNTEFKDLETFTSLTPSKEELAKCNSKFYNKINNN